MGKAQVAAALCDVREAVGKLKTQMKAVEKGNIPAPPSTQPRGPQLVVDELAPPINMHEREVSELRGQLAKAEAENKELRRKLEVVRKHFEPQYSSLQTLFAELGKGGNGGDTDMSVWEPWLKKAGSQGSGRRRMLEVVIQRGELTRNQIATLASMSPSSGTFSTYISWMKTNGLIIAEGNMVKLNQP